MHCLSYDTRYVYKPPMWKICTGHYGTAASQMIFTCKNLHKQNVTVRYKQNLHNFRANKNNHRYSIV